MRRYVEIIIRSRLAQHAKALFVRRERAIHVQVDGLLAEAVVTELEKRVPLNCCQRVKPVTPLYLVSISQYA